MALYNKAGANPMSGCIPALLQMPVFYALFTFFPVAFALRRKAFYGQMIYLLMTRFWTFLQYSILWRSCKFIPDFSIHSNFLLHQMTTGQQPMPQQPGMPNMKVIMYLMPLMMLFFFNNYASGLSLYYFVSNLLTICFDVESSKTLSSVDDSKILAQN